MKSKRPPHDDITCGIAHEWELQDGVGCPGCVYNVRTLAPMLFEREQKQKRQKLKRKRRHRKRDRLFAELLDLMTARPDDLRELLWTVLKSRKAKTA